MDFEWDDDKNQENIRKHGFDFGDAWEIFEAPLLAALDTRTHYGEDRWTGIGLLGNRIVVVTFTPRSADTIRIISLRKALKHERKKLKKPSATNWARIDQMTDEGIDTTDIPPLNDAFFASAQWRLPRLFIDLNDFGGARKLAAYILSQKLHEKKKTEPARARQQLVHLAFNTSLIISYSRPFHWNRNLKGQPGSSLREHTCDVLSEAEVEIHSRVLAMRDEAYAHSDARSHLFEGFDYSKYLHLPLMRAIETLDKSATRTLKIMTEKWISYLEIEKSKLKESLKQRT